MERTYTVYFGTEAVGQVLVQAKGLYYEFTCQCRMQEQGMYDLRICWEGGSEALGLLAPSEDGLCLRTKIPAKRVGQGELRFALKPRHEKELGHFAPVFPEQPFAYLQRLEGAYLATRQGQVGVVLDTKKL